MYHVIMKAIAGLADKKRSCRAGKEKKGMYKEKGEDDVPEEREANEGEVRSFPLVRSFCWLLLPSLPVSGTKFSLDSFVVVCLFLFLVGALVLGCINLCGVASCDVM